MRTDDPFALQPECICTGCTLLDMQQTRHVHGDLHIVGRALVFNAVLHNNETYWVYERRGGIVLRAQFVVSVMDGAFFERRGVIAFDAASCVLNEPLIAKLRRAGVYWPTG